MAEPMNDGDQEKSVTSFPTNNDNNSNNDSLIFVNCYVEVKDRMWPGMNKQGGIAKVTAIDHSHKTVSVEYVLNRARKEKAVSYEFIEFAPEYNLEPSSRDTNGVPVKLRDRSGLMGRCTRCGSLRMDCGTCDWNWVEQQRQQQAAEQPAAKSNNRKNNREKSVGRKQQRFHEDDDDDLSDDPFDSNASEGEENDLKNLVREHYLKKLHIKRQLKRLDRENNCLHHTQERAQKQPLPTGRKRPGENHHQGQRRLDNKATITIPAAKRRYIDSSSSSSSDDDDWRDNYYSHDSSSDDDDIPIGRLPAVAGRTNDPAHRFKKKLSTKRPSLSKASKREKTNSIPRQNTAHRPQNGASTDDNTDVEQKIEREQGTGAQDSDVDGAIIVTAVGESDVSQTSSDDDEENEGFPSIAFDDDDLREYYVGGESGDESVGTVDKEFVQPEGDRAAEKLPDDITDRVGMISFCDLPAFFEDEASRIERAVLPDFRLEVAELERQAKRHEPSSTSQRRRRQPPLDDTNMVNADAIAPAATIHELIKATEETLKRLTNQLIHDGADQCDRALLKMMKRPLQRKERERMTKEEWKQFRKHFSEASEFTRDSRMDNLNDQVKDLVEKADLVLSKLRRMGGVDNLWSTVCTGERSDSCVSDENSELADTGSAGFDMEDNAGPCDSNDLDGTLVARDLPHFDRHMHARPVLAREAPRSKRPRVRRRESSTRKKASNQPNKKVLYSSTSYTSSSIGQKKRAYMQVDSVATPSSPQSAGSTARFDRRRQGGASRGLGISGETTGIPKSPKSRRQKRSRTHADRPHGSRTRNAEHDEDFVRVEYHNAQNIPTLDQLLASPEAEDSLRFVRQASLRGREKRRLGSSQPITERMEAFLKANEEEIDCDIGSPAKRSGAGNDRNRTISRQGSISEFQGASPSSRCGGTSLVRPNPEVSASQSTVSAESRGQREAHIHGRRSVAHEARLHTVTGAEHVTADVLFSQLRNRADVAMSPEPSIMEQRQCIVDCSISDLCAALLEKYPSDAPGCERALQDLEANIASKRAETQDSHKSAEIVAVFNTLLTLLQANGSATVQELVSRGNITRVRLHVCVLVQLLCLIENSLNAHLSESDGLSFHVFSAPCSSLISHLMLQMLDSVLSLLNPTAWALATKDDSPHQEFLDALTPLRGAMGRITFLPESVSQCMLTEMEPQVWRLVDDPTVHAFVSSVDPKTWQSFLQSGQGLSKPTAVRLLCFNDGLPRSEIEAIWTALAWFASGTSRKPLDCESGSSCWKLASKVLLHGGLAHVQRRGNQNESLRLPPCESQLKACLKEIWYFSSLLSVGSLVNLPKNDTAICTAIRKAIDLQADDYELSAQARAGACPVFRQAKVDMRSVKSIWQELYSGSESSRTMRALDFTNKETDLFLDQPTFHPSSTILRHCLDLLSAYVARVPAKKPRLKRLCKSIETLAQGFTERAKNIEPDSSTEGTSVAPVADFFSVSSPGPNMGSAKSRKALFCREAAAYFIFTSFVHIRSQEGKLPSETIAIGKFNNVKDAALEVWKILADDAMVDRQRQIENFASGLFPYKGDEMRLYVTAKVIFFVIVVSLGDEQSLSLGLWSREKPCKELLVFLSSCLIACLDCLCDINGSADVMCPVFAYLASAYQLMGRILRAAESGSQDLEIFVPAITALGEVSLRMLSRSWLRCLQVMTNDCECRPASDICLRAAAAALQGALLLAALPSQTSSVEVDANDYRETTHTPPPDVNVVVKQDDLNKTPSVVAKANGQETRPPRLNVNGVVQSDDDAMFAGIDDDALAALDLNVFSNASRTTEEDSSYSIFHFLSRALKYSKPSLRFALQLSPAKGSNSEESNFSVPGRSLIARNRYYVCACLAGSIASANEKPINNLVSEILQYSDNEDEEDVDYQKGTTRLISQNLCTLATRTSRCVAAVQTNFEPILFCLVEALLDASSLVSHRIRGETRTFQEAFGLALAQQRGSSLTLRETAHDSTELGAVLLQSNSSHNVDLHSLDKACLDRFQVLFRIVSYAHQEQRGRGSVLFERICSLMIGASAGELARIIKNFKLHERSGVPGNREHRHLRARLMELLSCYTEVHVGLVMGILLESTHPLLNEFASTLTFVRDQFWCHLLQGRSIIVEDKLLALAKQKFSRSFCEVVAPSSEQDTSACADLLCWSIVRRSRELLVYLSSCCDATQFSLVHAMAKKLGEEVQVDSSNKFQIILRKAFAGEVPPSQQLRFSPVQNALGVFFEKSRPLTSEEQERLHILAQNVLMKVVPRINHAGTAVRDKLGMIILVQCVVDADRVFFSRGKEVQLSLVRIFRGVTSSLRSSIAADVVDEDVVSAVFSCTRSIVTSRFLAADSADANLLVWSNRMAYDDHDDDCTTEDTQATYVWLLSIWLLDIAKIIVEAGGKRSENLMLFRSQLNASSERLTWPPTDKSRILQESRLHNAEVRLFSGKENEVRQVENVYRKRTSTICSVGIGDTHLTEWIPSPNLCRVAKEYMAEIIPFC